MSKSELPARILSAAGRAGGGYYIHLNSYVNIIRRNCCDA